MTSNMDFRLILTKNADIIISNNQNIAKGDCTNIEPLLDTKPITQNPHLILGITDNSLPLNNSDLKDKYIKNYIHSASKYTPVLNYTPQ